MSKRGHLYVIAAPSGAGKTSLLKALMARRPGVGFSVSCTTRKPRPGETDGRDYHFIARNDFERLIAADEFIEHANVFGNLTPQAPLTPRSSNPTRYRDLDGGRAAIGFVPLITGMIMLTRWR